jgi:hypothetical protein
MTLTGIVQAAHYGAKGFDTDQVISREEAAFMKSQGFDFCARYLSIGREERPGDLFRTEAADILSGGLALFPVQHVDEPGWMPTGALGWAHGLVAIQDVDLVGFPPGVCVALDLEGVNASAAAADIIAYCNSWWSALSALYVPLLYVGANCGLSGEQLFADLKFQRYWKSLSEVPVPAPRGFCLVQSASPASYSGLAVDLDAAQVDSLQGAVTWLAPAAS